MSHARRRRSSQNRQVSMGSVISAVRVAIFHDDYPTKRSDGASGVGRTASAGRTESKTAASDDAADIETSSGAEQDMLVPATRVPNPIAVFPAVHTALMVLFNTFVLSAPFA